MGDASRTQVYRCSACRKEILGTLEQARGWWRKHQRGRSVCGLLQRRAALLMVNGDTAIEEAWS